MATSAIGSVSSSVFGTVGTSGNAAVGKDDFLKLLTTQMRYQNPLEPQKDAEFIAQLAQFSSLEGIQQLNNSFASMLLLQQMTQGANLIGKSVSFERTDSTVPGRGIVEAVRIEQGVLQLQVDGKLVPMNQLRGIESAGR